MREFNKGGETDWFIMSVIISIATLVILVLAIGVFPWRETIDREACRESIIVRASLPGDKLSLKDYANLRCKAKNICVTAKSSGKGECENLVGDFDTVRILDSDRFVVEDKIKMLLARDMAECWHMFGEGKLQIFSRAWTVSGSERMMGVICSKIEFDRTILYGKDKTQGNEDDIQEIRGFTDYLVSRKAPNKNVSYMDYLRGTFDGASADLYYGEIAKYNANLDSVGSIDYNSDVMDLNKIKTVFFVETVATNAGRLIGGIAGGTVGVLGGAIAGSWTVAKIGLVLTIPGAKIGDAIRDYFFGLPNGDTHLSGLFITDYDREGFEQFKIYSFENIA